MACSAVARLRVDAVHVAEHPEEQVDGVDALVHQRPAAVERPRAPPPRLAVVLGGTIPFHPGVGHARRGPGRRPRCRPRGRSARGCERSWKKTPSVTPARATAAISRSMRAVVISIGFSQMTCSPCAAAASICSPCTPGRTADGDDVERAVTQEGLDVGVGRRPGSGRRAHAGGPRPCRTRPTPAGPAPRPRPGRASR